MLFVLYKDMYTVFYYTDINAVNDFISPYPMNSEETFQTRGHVLASIFDILNDDE